MRTRSIYAADVEAHICAGPRQAPICLRRYAISVPDALGPIQTLKLWLEADDKEHGWYVSTHVWRALLGLSQGSALTFRYVDTITLTGAGEEGTFHCGTDVFVGEHRAVVAERTRSSSDSDW